MYKNSIRKDVHLRQKSIFAELRNKIFNSYKCDARCDTSFRNVLNLYSRNMSLRGTHQKNHCSFSGRSRAVYRRFGVSRITLLERARASQYIGLRKAVW